MQVSEWSSLCNHEFCMIMEVNFENRKRNYFAESCHRCPRITLYDNVTKDPLLALDERTCMPARLVFTANGTILMSDLSGDRLVELQWDKQLMKLQMTDWVLNLDLGIVSGMTYLESGSSSLW